MPGSSGEKMLKGVIDHPDAQHYRKRFAEGRFLFREGDDSRDLFILVSGEMEVLKGTRVISRIAQPGALFGEMSFLLGGNRTASLRTVGETEVFQVPWDEIPAFMERFPGVPLEMSRLLAKRLEKTTRVSYGLSEFCDRLPDAVLLSDEKGRLLAWNRAAESLYGIGGDAPGAPGVESIYEDPQAYRQFIEGASSQTPVREKILAVRRPGGRTGFVSTSLTLLYDGHHNFQGVLSLGRDVTAVCRLERRYRLVRRWAIPGLVLLALLAGALLYGYPYYQRGQRSGREDPTGLHTLLLKDYLFIKSLVAGRLDRNAPPMNRLLAEFMALQGDTAPPYTGLLLLDGAKRVVDAVSLVTRDTQPTLVGSSYGAIDFRGPPESIHRVLVLYRTDADHPMGARGVELAFRLISPDGNPGWLVFQMDAKKLKSDYGIDEGQLAAMVFKPVDSRQR